jgi:Uma2 family endonuclease
MASLPDALKLTYDDYQCLPDDGKRHEIIDGEHCVTPAPSTKHQRISGNLFLLLGAHIRRSKAGELFAAPTDVLLSDVDIVEPDLVFIAAERLGMITPRYIQGAPDLVIEIVSETTRRRDEVVKRKLYELYGVAEYWVVDPELDLVKCYRLESQRYVLAGEYALERDDIITTPLFPALPIPLREIFVS